MTKKTAKKRKYAFEVVPFGKDEEPSDSLLEQAMKSGAVETTTHAQVYKARNLYVSKVKSKRYVAKAVGIKRTTLERWIYTFGWEEERDERVGRMQAKLFKDIRKGLPNVDERADRLCDGIEGILEDMVQDHLDGRSRLKPAELTSIVHALNRSHEMRKEIRGKVKESHVTVSGNIDFVAQLGEMAARVSGKKMLGNEDPNTLSLKAENVEDAEFEILQDEGTPE